MYFGNFGNFVYIYTGTYQSPPYISNKERRMPKVGETVAAA